ncbi:MAG: hypothetical protein ACI9GM_000071 [Salibacteraceae bacterium]|jgi:hypothetical protein
MKKYLGFILPLILFEIPVYLIITHQTESLGFITQLTVFVLLPFFIFNMIARKYLPFKSYFTSKYNLLLECQKETSHYELCKDIMFTKRIETIEISKLQLEQTNEEKGQILASISLSFKSWGENIYIMLNQKDNYPEVIIEMTTILQVSSWGKNKANYRTILTQFEESLII